MKRLLLALAAVFAALTLRAQDERYEALGDKLEEYFSALAGEPLSVQNAECDFLIESCKDSLVRQFVTLKIYDHYPVQNRNFSTRFQPRKSRLSTKKIS